MSRPVWNTPSGFLLTATEQVFVSTSVLATGTSVTYSLLNGNLPSGLILLNTGTIIGTPDIVLARTSSTFTLRASNTLGKTDRTFRIDVDGPDPTVYTTSNVYLSVGPNQEQYVYYNQYIKTQLTATSDTGTVSYSIVGGNFPKNLILTENGLITGYVGEIVTTFNTFSFIVSATNSISYSTATFKIEVRPLNYDILLPIQLLTDGNLGQYKSNATHVIDLPLYDPRKYLGTTTYTLSTGTLPENLTLNTTTGVISGYIPSQLESLSTSTFDITIAKVYKNTSSVFTETFNLTTIGPIITTLSWEKTGSLGSLFVREISYLSVNAITTSNVAVKKYQINSGNLPNNLILQPDGSISGIVAVNTSVNTATTIHTFTIDGYDENNKVVANSEFSITTVQTTSTDYSKIFCRPFLSIEKRRELQEFLNNKEIFIPDWIYRPFDPNFGIVRNIELPIDYGIEKKHLTVYYELLGDIFYKRRFQFGDLKYAVANIDNDTIYEVIYLEIVDGSGDDFSQKMKVRSGNNQGFELDLFIDPENITLTNPSNYNNTITSIRRALRTHLKYTDRANPQYMKTIQPNSYTELGYIAHIPLCFTKPGKAKYLINKINDSSIDFKLFDLELDRFYIDQTIQI